MANKQAKGTVGNKGGQYPHHLRNLSPEQAQQTVDFYSAESTYNPQVNEEAFPHVKALLEHTEILANSNPKNTDLQDAHRAATIAASAHSAKDNETALDHVRQATASLRAASYDPAHSAATKDLIGKASEHATSYLSKFTPAWSEPNADGTVKVGLDPDYRAKAFVETEVKKEYRKQDPSLRGYPNADAMYQGYVLPQAQARKARKQAGE